MISKMGARFLFAVCLAGILHGAEVLPSVPVGLAAHYRTSVKDLPQGVYEWDEQGKLFVQVRVSRRDADGDDVGGLVLQAQHQELYAWLARRAAVLKKDVPLAPALDWVRRQVRAFNPLWEYTANWSYRLEGPSFSRDEGDFRIACLVCDRSQVEASMPAAFLQALPPEAWLEGARI